MISNIFSHYLVTANSLCLAVIYLFSQVLLCSPSKSPKLSCTLALTLQASSDLSFFPPLESVFPHAISQSEGDFSSALHLYGLLNFSCRIGTPLCVRISPLLFTLRDFILSHFAFKRVYFPPSHPTFELFRIAACPIPDTEQMVLKSCRDPSPA